MHMQFGLGQGIEPVVHGVLILSSGAIVPDSTGIAPL
jgi:hypothetical protein